jgi:hypothetical protein
MKFSNQIMNPLSNKSVSSCLRSILLFAVIILIALTFVLPVASATAPVITPQILPVGQVFSFYSATLSAFPIQLPAVWVISSGALPSGLGLSPFSGVIQGTPSAAGTFYFNVQVTDNTTLSSIPQPFYITINPRPLVINTTTLPDGVAGTAYSASISVSGGTTPYSWNLASGNLPAGLVLNVNTGIISGTIARTVGGFFSFTVKVTDSSSPQLTAQTTYNISVQKATYQATITIDPSLLGGFTKVNIDGAQVTTLRGGDSYNFTVDVGVTKTVTIDSVVADPNNSGIRYETGINTQTISEGQPVVVFGYFTDYKIDVAISPPQITSISGGGWFKKNDVISLSTKTDVAGNADTEYKFNSWSLPDGSKVTSATLNWIVTVPGTITATFDTYYRLLVQSVYGEVNGGGFFKAGTAATWSVVNSQVPMDGLLGFFQGKFKAVNPSGTETMDAPKTVTITWEPDYMLPYILIPLSILVFIAIIVGIYLLVRRPRPKQSFEPAPGPMPGPPQPTAFPRPIPQQHTTVVMIDKGNQTKQLPPTTREQLIEKFSQLLDTYESEIKSNLGTKEAPTLKPAIDKMISAPGAESNVFEAEVVKDVGETGVCGTKTKTLLRTVVSNWRQADSSTVQLPPDDNNKEEHTGLSVTWARDIYHEWKILNCKLPTVHQGNHKGESRIVYSLLNTITINKTYDQNEPMQPPSPHFTDNMPEVAPGEDNIVPTNELPEQTA